jgi:hypothetical protein
METSRFGKTTPTIRRLSSSGIEVRNVSPDPSRDSHRMQINVVFTNIEGTTAALKRAVDLVIDLEGETRIIVPHVVPFPLPLEEPTVPIEFTCQQIQCLAGSVGADPYVDVFLCRDRFDLLRQVLPSEAIVVIGTRKHWLPTMAWRTARALRKHGCIVLLAPYE